MHKQLLVLVITLGLSAAVSAETIIMTVTGMACSLCEKGIEKTFRAQPEVKTVDVDLENKLITVTTRPGRTLDDRKIIQLLKNSGYSVAAIKRAK
jgi:copper chaperone CopZ